MSVSGVDFTQIIPNGTELPDCTVGLSLSNAVPSCMLKVSIEGESGKSVDDDIEVVTDVQTLDIAIQTSFVNTGSTSLPQGQVSPAPIVAPDTSVQIKVSNSQANTESFNNLHVTLPSWLADIATNLVGGTVSTNGDGNTVITYTVNGANVNLAPGQTHTFSFDLGGDQTTVDTLLAHYAELIDNNDSDVIVVNASNLRNPITPDLTVSLTPASMTEEVTLSDPNEPQTVTLQNLSNSQLQITAIDDSNLPDGVYIVEGAGTTCSTVVGEYIEPAGDAGDNCTVQLSVEIDAVPEDNKTLVIEYNDPQHNPFEDSTDVNIGGAVIAINNFDSIELPVNGDKTTNVTITNTGALNWKPSAIPVSYEITQQGQSTPAANISVTDGSGTDCLAGAAVAPGLSCNIGIETTVGNADPEDDTEPGTYVLNVLPSNDGNLEAPVTKIFSVTEPTLGSFQFQNEDGDPINTQNFEIGDSPITIQVANVGAVEITDVSLTIPDKFMTDDPEPGDTICPEAPATISLPSNESCSLKIFVADGAGTGGDNNPQAYEIEATGDTETVSNSPQALTATVQGAKVTIPDNISIALPSGMAPTEAVITITNNGTNTIAWQPSDDPDDYTVTGDNTTGISVVSTGNPSACGEIGEVGTEVGDNSCTITIEVEDTATEGIYTLTLNLANNLAAAQPKSFEVTGTLGYFSFSPASITIGTDSTNQPQEITLSNNGDTDITNVSLTLPVSAGFIVQNGCAGISTLPSGGNCTFQVSANNNADQGSIVTILANGDEETVENNEAEFETFINGVVVQIESINDDEAINRPAAGPQTTNVELTNLGNINWIPSNLANADKYEIKFNGEAAANISVVAPQSLDVGQNSCLAGADVAPDGSCYVGIQTVSSTPEGAYTLTALATGNLPQDSKPPADFTIDESLGYFTYSGDGIDNDELTLTIGDDPVTIILTNIGDTEITAVALNTGDDANKFDVTNSGTCDDQTLAASIGSCTFDLALSGTAVADADYSFVTTGDDSTVSNSPAELTVTAEAAPPATDCNAVDLECRVFVTNSTGDGDFSTWGNAGGATSLDAANNICAGDDNNPGGNFKAWISTDAEDAKDNINYGAGITYVRADDTDTVIAGPGGLVDTYANDFTNSVSAAYTTLFTGTNAAGTALDDGPYATRTCHNWTSNLGYSPQVGDRVKGAYGRSDATDSAWTYAGTPYCYLDTAHIMCFESIPE